MELIVRRGRLSDIPDLVKMLEDLFSIEADFQFDQARQEAGLSMIIDSESDERIILVAESEGELIGMCSAQTLISTAEGARAAMVEDMIVSKRYRGQGIGKMIMDEIVEWAKRTGKTRLQLLADRNNTRALWFYNKNGWENTRLICLRKKKI
ncbi:MAG: GNAT family N-acetyltransferase [Deltaproteobacteria bacterium]|nr:GNAT family N-acetyltransferase [Deltaproteobacteria bacterium]